MVDYRNKITVILNNYLVFCDHKVYVLTQIFANTILSLACRVLCYRGRQDHRKHSLGHMPFRVHVCGCWGAAVQGRHKQSVVQANAPMGWFFQINIPSFSINTCLPRSRVLLGLKFKVSVVSPRATRSI